MHAAAFGAKACPHGVMFASAWSVGYKLPMSAKSLSTGFDRDLLTAPFFPRGAVFFFLGEIVNMTGETHGITT